MSDALTPSDKFNAAQDLALLLIKAWGLPKHVTRLELVIEAAGMPVVRCEFYPDLTVLPVETLTREFTLQRRSAVITDRPAVPTAEGEAVFAAAEASAAACAAAAEAGHAG